jgi:small subunit ribosomal protein S6
MSIYETIVILDSLLPLKDIDAAVERFTGIITTNGGKIRKLDKWGKKRFAYEIQKKQYGFYVAIEFEGAGNIPRELENEYNFNDKVIRYLTYLYDKHKLKAMENEALTALQAEEKEYLNRTENSANPEGTKTKVDKTETSTDNTVIAEGLEEVQ